MASRQWRSTTRLKKLTGLLIAGSCIARMDNSDFKGVSVAKRFTEFTDREEVKFYKNGIHRKDKWICVTGGDVAAKHIWDIPAVYVIYIDGILSYVGQSNTPQFRFRQHGFGFYQKYITPWGEFDDLYAKIKHPSKYGEEAMIEKRLIRKLRPRFNSYLYKQKKNCSLF